MREARAYAVLSNGHQTDQVTQKGMLALRRYQYEPDVPNFTPRITACSFDEGQDGHGREWRTVVSILRKSPWCDACERHQYEYSDIARGLGYCMTTYSGDGKPLPAFQGEPYLLSLVGDAPAVAGKLWGALNAENRVSLAVKFIPRIGASHIHIINKYEKMKVSARQGSVLTV